MSRVSKITPAQGANWRTQYTYNANGSLASVDAYDSGTAQTTTYSYDTTSGKLTQRNLPTVSSNNIRTTYAYDAAGRLEYETVTREAGGTTNLSRTQYAYAYIAAGSGGGRSLTRTEQIWGGSSWDNDNKVLYEWNALEWMRYEQRHDWVSSAWSAVYDVSQEYDKNGNRTRYHKNVQGLTADYGIQCDLSYTYDGRNFLSLITDADAAGYQCAVTCDLNNNITEVAERMSGQGGTPENNFLYTYFEYDALNRLLAHKTKQYVTPHNRWLWSKREHAYDALGRAAASGFQQWPDGSPEPGATTVEHVYDQSGRHLQNYDGTSSYGAVWHWAGTEPMPNTAGPLRSPNADTASQVAYNDANNVTPQRRTYLNPTTEGDERNEWGQGRPQAKDAGGAGTNWATGTLSQPQNGNMNIVESRLMFEGTVTTDLSRATDAREKGRIGIFGTGLSYAGSYGRVTSETIGRDLNPLGRGDGMAYVAGWMDLTMILPALPKATIQRGNGNSVNNGCCDTELMMPDDSTDSEAESSDSSESQPEEGHTNCPHGSPQFHAWQRCSMAADRKRLSCEAAVMATSALLALAVMAALVVLYKLLAVLLKLTKALDTLRKLGGSLKKLWDLIFRGKGGAQISLGAWWAGGVVIAILAYANCKLWCKLRGAGEECYRNCDRNLALSILKAMLSEPGQAATSLTSLLMGLICYLWWQLLYFRWWGNMEFCQCERDWQFERNACVNGGCGKIMPVTNCDIQVGPAPRLEDTCGHLGR